MGKSATPRPWDDHEANASHPMLRVSPRKLGLVVDAIRGLPVEKALAFLKFDAKRISRDVYQVLLSAVANAENNHGLDIDRLYVSRAVAGKSLTMKRMRPMAKGRGGRILKPFSRLDICVAQYEEDI